MISALVLAARAISFVITEGGAEYGFAVSSTQTFVKAARISSTAVRQALAEDNLALAESRWDIPYYFRRVVHGDELGRTITS